MTSTATDLFTPAIEPEPEPAHPTTPGHATARRFGCICPQFINSDGYGLRTEVGKLEAGAFLAHPHCQLHGTL